MQPSARQPEQEQRPVPGLTLLAPTDATNLHQQAYSQLRQALMSGKFMPGETLTLRRLAAALGTSIMPARDAVLRLTAERALEVDRRSVRVPVMTLDRLRDVTRMRLALEGEAAALAAERATAADIDAMRAADRAALRLQVAGQASRFLAANEAFHFEVYRAARSDLLVSLIETLWLQIGPYLGYLMHSEGEADLLAADLSSHEVLVAAVERRDPDAARAALVADLKDANDVFRPFTNPSAVPQGEATTLRSRKPAAA